MFRRFGKGARRAVARSYQEARALRHGTIGTEHLLLALAAEPDGAAADILAGAGIEYGELRERLSAPAGAPAWLDRKALATIGIDLDAVCERIEATFGAGALERGARGSGIRFSPEAKRALRLAVSEARTIRPGAVEREHILVGLAGAGGGARELLRAAQLDQARLRGLVRAARTA